MAKLPKVEGLCHLCGVYGPLKNSHILSDWGYRDEIRGNGGQFVNLRELRTDNQAFTEYLLCPACEQMFGRWENQAKQAGKRSEPGSNYGPWLLKFATSISWRVVKYFQLQPPAERSEGLNEVLIQPFVGEALECWREFLLHDRQNGLWPLHQQHLFPVAADYPIRRALGFTISCDGERVFAWSRFSFYSFVGILADADPDALKSSAIQKDGGVFPSYICVPPSLGRWLVDTELEAARRAKEYADKWKITPPDTSRK